MMTEGKEFETGAREHVAGTQKGPSLTDVTFPADREAAHIVDTYRFPWKAPVDRVAIAESLEDHVLEDDATRSASARDCRPAIPA